MAKLLLIDEDDLEKSIMTCLEKFFNGKGLGDYIPTSNTDDEVVTNLVQVAKLCRCSLPTAQKIKNAIPKDLYMQVNKSFAIKKSVLLLASNKRKIK